METTFSEPENTRPRGLRGAEAKVDKNSVVVFKLTWSVILISFSISFLNIAQELLKATYENVFGFLGVIFGLAWFLTFFVGYIITHFMIAPWLLSKHGRRSIRESYLWIGNCLFAEIELKELSSINDDQSIRSTLKLISICKISLIVTLILSVTFFVLAN